MPKPVDAHPASPGAREETFQVYVRDHHGKTFKIGPPSGIAFITGWVEIARRGLWSDVSCFWIEKVGGIDLSSEPAIAALARDDALAVAQLPEPQEPARRGVVDPGLRVCAGLRLTVTPQEIEKQIIRDIEKWIVFCFWAIGGGIVAVSDYVLFVVE